MPAADRLARVRPQERVPRHIVEQIVDSAPVLPLLHAPVPQTVDSVGEVLKILDKLVPDVEQVIDVPMIYTEDFRVRTFRSQDRVHPLLLTIQLVILKLWMSLEMGFSHFPQINKSAKLGPHSSRRVHVSVSSSTPAPHHRTRLWDWVMVITDQGPYFWDRSTGETRWVVAA